MTKKSRPRAKGKARSGTWSLLQNKLFTLFIVLLPVQLGLYFWPDWALVSGIRVDYLAPVIYLTDLIVIALLVVSFKDIKTINLAWIIAITIFALVNIYFANVWQIALLKWFKYLEVFLLGVFIYQNKKLVIENINFPLSIAVIYSSVIAILQFFLGHTIGGALYLLG